MSTLREWIYLSPEDKPYINFETSLEDNAVVSGYVPVKSTLDVLEFLKEATSLSAPRGRAVICQGTYGSGKSRLCTVLSRLFRDGFDCPPLQPVWGQLSKRGLADSVTDLKKAMLPGGRAWRPWLVVTLFGDGGGGTLGSVLIRALLKAIRRAKLNDSILGHTIFQAAVQRLDQILGGSVSYSPTTSKSPFATAEQLRRALEQDLDEHALEEFDAFHRQVTHGIEFRDYIQGSGNVATKAEDVYNLVASGVQQYGYEGIVILWDEFGLAIEELLSSGHQGRRNLTQEAMALQEFVERSCSMNELGKRTVFLGFTHLSLTEYGSRAGLNENERNRLATVADRFRKPSIFIRLSVTEVEGYHLVGGMLHHTSAGADIFNNPMPLLQQLANRMPRQKFWSSLSAETCYQEIVAPCYPLHPATVAALLLLSDQIAQVNRTTFYYLQNSEEGGLASALASRELPPVAKVGDGELLRLQDLFGFFAQPIKESRRQLFDQFEEAVARFPGATENDLAVLRAILILTVIKNAEMAPTTAFLSFSLFDAEREELAAAPLHEALGRLKEAHAVWKNEATDVWNFVSDRGLGGDLDRELGEEQALIPTQHTPAQLLRNYPGLVHEITDLLGDGDLDPCESGTVRRLGVRLLDPTKGEKAVERVNLAVDDASELWRSALVYLVAADGPAQLDVCRKLATAPSRGTVYFVFPDKPLYMNGNKLRELIAVQKLLEKKDPQSHAYEVLENKLTRLRTELREEFAKAFGNAGLRSGTTVQRAGESPRPVEVLSWHELLPAISADLDNEYRHQVRVRCGVFNEWQGQNASQWNKIENVVERILGFDDKADWQKEFLGFKDTSQDAAVVDGVLVENGLFTRNPLTDKWELNKPTSDSNLEALREILRHFRTGGSGDKEFVKLYDKLIEPPYGIPNGVVPLLVALAFRAEPARIVIYFRKTNQLERISDAKLAEAIVNMARYPSRYTTRYNKLSNKQRWVFKTLGPVIGVVFTDDLAPADKFESYAEQIRTTLQTWAKPLSDGVLAQAELTEAQKRLLKTLRGGVPPQLSLLADSLLGFLEEDNQAREEVADGGNNLTSFPATVQLWRTFRDKIEQHAEGMKAPIRRQLEAAGGDLSLLEKLKKVEKFGNNGSGLAPIVERLSTISADGDPVENLVSAVNNKDVKNLTAEDYGRANGLLNVVIGITPTDGQGFVVLPDGAKHTLTPCSHPEARARLRADMRACQEQFALTSDQLAALVLEVLYADELAAPDSTTTITSESAASPSPAS